jgi:hypothetical protein
LFIFSAEVKEFKRRNELTSGYQGFKILILKVNTMGMYLRHESTGGCKDEKNKDLEPLLNKFRPGVNPLAFISFH